MIGLRAQRSGNDLNPHKRSYLDRNDSNRGEEPSGGSSTNHCEIREHQEGRIENNQHPSHHRFRAEFSALMQPVLAELSSGLRWYAEANAPRPGKRRPMPLPPLA